MIPKLRLFLIENAVDIRESVDVHQRQCVGQASVLSQSDQETVAVRQLDQRVFIGQFSDFLEQHGVFEGYGNIAAEDLQQFEIKRAQLVIDVNERRDGNASGGAEEKPCRFAEVVAVFGQRAFQFATHARIGDVCSGRPIQLE